MESDVDVDVCPSKYRHDDVIRGTGAHDLWRHNNVSAVHSARQADKVANASDRMSFCGEYEIRSKLTTCDCAVQYSLVKVCALCTKEHQVLIHEAY